ncbi:MAG TPA: DUF1186 domain-containing protein [bacterium]|nr:DUF1186 domain-containing protein [bacterium]
MELEKIIAELSTGTREIPREALAEAAAHREEIIPALVASLESAVDDPGVVAESVENSSLLCHALYLLAQFREKRAYPLIVKLFSLPEDELDQLTGDILTQDGHRILASVCQGDTGLIKELLENPEAYEFSRSAGLCSLLVLLKAGQISREEVMEYFKSLFHGKLEREPSSIWSDLVCCCSDIWPGEVIEEIREAFDDGRIDPAMIGPREFERDFKAGKDQCLARDLGNYTMIDDVAKDTSWWSCYHHRDEWDEDEEDDEDGYYGESDEDDPLTDDISPDTVIRSGGGTYIREAPKVGRNDPCPCGSGKKYKKCCGK